MYKMIQLMKELIDGWCKKVLSEQNEFIIVYSIIKALYKGFYKKTNRRII